MKTPGMSSSSRQEPTCHCPSAAGWGCNGRDQCWSVAEEWDSGSTCCSVADIAAQGKRSHCRRLQEREEPVVMVTASSWLSYEDYHLHCWFQTGCDWPSWEAQVSVVGHIRHWGER